MKTRTTSDGGMAESGSCKFICERVPLPIGQFAGFAELNEYRRRLLQHGMIGVDGNGIGFGNLSMREGASSRFYITGSGTGGITELMPSHCARVVAYDFATNWLQCEGSIVASSESFTHAAVYESDPAVSAVIHIHEMKLWAALLHKVPTTPENIEYGTPQMAYVVRRLFDKPSADVSGKKIFVMAGHKGGIVVFGEDLGSAFSELERRSASGAA
jgi:L-ribulose-5-phosphate 4-epimerase